MESVIAAFDDLAERGVIKSYVIGGATALLYFSRPTFTEDIDVFIYLGSDDQLVDLSPVYHALSSRQGIRMEGEHIYIDGFPVQLLVPYDALSQEAFDHAVSVSLVGKQCRIFNLEYLMAIMIQLNKPKYREA